MARVHHRYPPVHRAQAAFTIPQSNLLPEGLAADVEKHIFYVGSMYHKKIVKISASGTISDFVKPGLYDWMPVGGVHVDPTDHSVWAATDPRLKNRSEIVHFDTHGKLLERFAAPGAGPHDLNDLVLRDTREIYVTDTEADQVYRFDRITHRFSPLVLPRPIFYPNGITLSGDATFLFIADMLGVLRADLKNGEVQEVQLTGHYTFAGIDGLYWYRGEPGRSAVRSRFVSHCGVAAYCRWKKCHVRPDTRISHAVREGTHYGCDCRHKILFHLKYWHKQFG